MKTPAEKAHAQKLVDSIEKHAPRVAQGAKALEGAITRERTAEAAILARVVEAMRPALDAMASRIPIAADGAGHVTFDERRGVLVLGEPRPTEVRPGALGAGDALYLLTDGTFLQVDYAPASPGEGPTGWRSHRESLSVDALKDEYELVDVLRGLRNALARREYGPKVAEANTRAERLENLAKLLELLPPLVK